MNLVGLDKTMKLRWVLATSIAAMALQFTMMAKVMSHGDVTPQAVDTEGLTPLGDEFLLENPYRLAGGCLLYTSPSPRDS